MAPPNPHCARIEAACAAFCADCACALALSAVQFATRAAVACIVSGVAEQGYLKGDAEWTSPPSASSLPSSRALSRSFRDCSALSGAYVERVPSPAPRRRPPMPRHRRLLQATARLRFKDMRLRQCRPLSKSACPSLRHASVDRPRSRRRLSALRRWRVAGRRLDSTHWWRRDRRVGRCAARRSGYRG